MTIRWRRWLGPPLALASGAVWALCFGREGLVVAPWLALVPFLLLLRRRPGAATGFLFGFGYWLTAVPWIQPTLDTFGGLPAGVATLALGAAAAYLAVYSALFGVVARRAQRVAPALSAILLPAAWVALETLRGAGPLAFPWNLAGYTLSEFPGALPLTAWVGSWGLSFLVVAVNELLARAIDERRLRPAAVAAGLVAATLGAGAMAGSGVAPGLGAGDPVVLLQPDSAVTVEVDAKLAHAAYSRLVAQSESACDAGPALLVWPESAAWPFSYQRHAQVRRDVAALGARGCPVLLNSTTRDGDAAYNSVYLVAPERPEQRYDKELLVPFGETVPFAGWLPGLRAIARTAGGFSPGRGGSPLAWREQRLGLSICFEIVFPAKAARQTRAGATALVTVTNDGWYGDSSAPYQHFRAARFRAAENRRPVLRAAITGISGVIAADGSVVGKLGVGERGELAAALTGGSGGSGGSGLTFFSRLPWLVPGLCWALVPFAIFRRGKE